MNNLNGWIVGGISGLILGFIISPMVFQTDRMMNDGKQAMNNIDRHFIEQMIPHHEGAIDMAQLALEKAKRPETKTLATQIITDQNKEITDMKAWYKEWFGIDVPVVGQHMVNGQMMGGMNHMDSMSGDMETLKNAKDFDLEFVQQMIPHHEMAVMMAQMLKASTDRTEMKTLADNIITSQTREIDMMRLWVKEWSN